MAGQPEWRLAFVLPNLCLRDFHSTPAQLTLGLEGIAIVPASDPRVSEIREWSSAADKVLDCFRDDYRQVIIPSVLIIREDWDSDLHRRAAPLIAFRNAVAAASVLPARASWSHERFTLSWGSYWSDPFDHHPIQLGLDGSYWHMLSPALKHVAVPLDGLTLTTNPSIPRRNVRVLDQQLADRLGRLWRRRYRQNRDIQKIRRVFRSLEAAYEALAMRFKNYESLSELGLGAVPWATAVEILASPAKENVSKWDCVRLIGRAPHARTRQVERKTYWAKHRGRRRPLTLAQKTFLHIYEARNKFVHGDRVSRKLLLPYRKGTLPLLSMASTVYRVAVISYLQEHWPWEMPTGNPILLADEMTYDHHLLKAVGKA